jgi:hypothetical protein
MISCGLSSFSIPFNPMPATTIIPNALPRMDGFIYDPHVISSSSIASKEDEVAWIKPVTKESRLCLDVYIHKVSVYDKNEGVYYYSDMNIWTHMCQICFKRGLRFVLVTNSLGSDDIFEHLK